MSAVVKENHVETIFDYELTDEESELLTYGLSKDKYIEYASDESIYMGLAALFAMRGDKKKADYYKSLLNKDFVRTHIRWDSIRPTIP